MPTASHFKELIVWQKALVLSKEIYRTTDRLPRSEEYSLSSQMRRAAISIPSNIAEGSKRGTTKDFLQFLRIANGSAAELETQLFIAKDLYPRIRWEPSLQILSEVQRMLQALIRRMA